jgi:DNA-binding transcriptional MocR family regulator
MNVPSIHIRAVERQSKSPIYRQIAEQIRLQISDGRMPPGTQLPTVRELALLLSVTRLTVQNAYRDLQADGWVESTVGRGTFVTASADTQAILARVGRQKTPEHVMSDMNLLTRLAGVRSMAYAEPDQALYPMTDFMRFFDHPSSREVDLMQYGPPQGDEMLRVELVRLLAERGIAATPDDLLITGGVTQGLSLLTGSLTRPGDVVAVEQPVYLGMLHMLNVCGVIPACVPIDNEGICLDALDQVIQTQHPRFLYTIPSFQNPTGACMSSQRRRDLLEMARHYDLLVVEDDIYGLLAYDGAPPTPIKAFDTDDRVIYMSSMSKMLMPGLRIGYMVVPEKLRERLVLYRQAQDLSSPPMLQRALASFLHRGRFKAHLERVLPHYRARRDETLRTLAQKLPSSVIWSHPSGGFCCWVTLPRLPADFHQVALQHGVAFTPGEVFLVEPAQHSHLRVCFGGLGPELIREAITILGMLLDQSYVPPAQRIRGLSHRLPLV